ncbi:peptidase [Streptomyces sp. MS2.AVA.5]|uniref:Peptidase n=1 Tax=Streptomyces achmelvichensis TaxID=3134111 RepID=A0ACC6Q8T4_9ACTN
MDHLIPGSTIERRLEVSNKTSTARRVDLYPSAAEIKGNKFLFSEGRASNELTEWISITPTGETLPSRKASEAMVTIKVPKTAGPGERYAVLWAENSAPPDARHNIGAVARVGVRIYLDIATGPEFCDFTIDKLTITRDKGGRPKALARVRNTGKRALDLMGTLSLTDGPGAMSAGPYSATPGTTLPPNGHGTVEVPLSPSLPEGRWKATLRLESGTVKRQVVMKLTLPKPGATTEASFLDPTGFGLWSGIVVILGFAVLVAGVIRIRRQAPSRPDRME